MKKILVCIGIVIGFVASAQQKAQYTQYMINPFLLNPAVSGTEEYMDLRAGYRQQWAGFEGAPRTMYFSGHTNIGRKHINSRSRHKKDGFHGVGLIINSDAIGPSTSTSISGAYSYHLTLAKKLFWSMGANGGINFFAMDAGVLKTATADDPSIQGLNSTSLADFNVGTWLYSDRFYAGLAMNQVYNQKMYNQNTNAVDIGKLAHHYYITGGYRIPFGYGEWSYIPSVLIKAVSPAPMSFDINSKVRYKDLGWFGVSYRNRDAVALLAGIVIANTVDFSYSYDFTTSNIRQYSGGSHEIVVGVRLRSRQQVLCPSHFW